MSSPSPAPGHENGTTDPVVVMVRMPPDLKARLKAQADTEHRSMSSQVVALLEQALPPGPAG